MPSVVVRVSRSHRYLFWMGVVLHTFWGFALLLSPDPMGVTGIHVFASFVPDHTLLGIGALIVAVLAALSASGKARGVPGAVCLTPQQIGLIVSACGALYYALSGHYAGNLWAEPS